MGKYEVYVIEDDGTKSLFMSDLTYHMAQRIVYALNYHFKAKATII